MKRGLLMLVGVLLAGVVAASGYSADDPDEPPVRLKKKGQPPAQAPAEEPRKPKADDKAPDSPKEQEKAKPVDGPDLPPENDEDDKDVLDRVARNMRSLEDRLANKEVGESTRQLSEEVIKDLDLLIERQQQGQSQASDQSQAQQQQQQQQQQQDRQQQQQQQQQQRSERGSQAQNKMRREQQQANGRQQRNQRQQANRRQQQQPPGNEQKDQTAKNSSPNMEPGKTGTETTKEPNKLAEIYKDIWGHLPESKRAEMDAYAREKFMPKYSELIKQYYATLAEKSRKQGD